MTIESENNHDLATLPAAAVAALTTEHFVLQTARSAAISDTNGRTSLYLSSVSSALIALAFVGQASRFGGAFYVTGLTILPALIFVGYATFERAIQTSIEDLAYARRISRIRSYYRRGSAVLTNLLAAPGDATGVGIMRELGITNLWWQNLVAIAGVVGVINSMIFGATVGLLVNISTDSLVASAISGVVAALAAFVAHVARQRALWRRAEASNG